MAVSQPNHLLGYRRTLLKLTFANVNDLLAVRRTVAPIAERNKRKLNAMDIYAEVARYYQTLSKSKDGTELTVF